ncbi:MAG: NUDIX hydrolase, partial [Limnohabitans sp.]|nr:NUDIX hydrolase [Limnohabitans sp.]
MSILSKKIRSEEIPKGDFMHAFRDTVALPNGLEATRVYVVHPCAAMIIPIFSNGDILMERQYRYPIQQVMIEFPAGKLNAGESSLSCAQREFKEETGYTAGQWARAGMIHP